MTRLQEQLVKQVNSFKVPLSQNQSQLIQNRLYTLSFHLIELKDIYLSVADGILLLNKTNA